VPGTSIKVKSIVSVPPAAGTGSSWTLPRDTKALDLRVVLEGRAHVTVGVRLIVGDNTILYADEQTRDVDGTLELAFPGVKLPRLGRSTLRLEITAPGVHQRTRISITRG
jgi:hypothetical protein